MSIKTIVKSWLYEWWLDLEAAGKTILHVPGGGAVIALYTLGVLGIGWLLG